MHSKILFISTIIMLMLLSCNYHKDSNIINTADYLLWENPDSCIDYIINNENSISKYDMNRVEVIYQHAYLKLTKEIADSIKLGYAIEGALKEKDYRTAGEAFYIYGAYCVQKGDYLNATIFLKEAETELMLADTVSNILKGMVLFYLGGAAEQGRLFEVAQEYYKASIPFLKKSNKAQYISACYHHLAKGCTNPDTCTMYIDSAILYSNQTNSPLLQTEVKTTKLQLSHTEERDNIDQLSKNIAFLCDSCEVYSYAAEIVTEEIGKKNYKKAQEYLMKLSLDTAFSIWSKEQYHSLEAELLFRLGKQDEAFIALQKLHKQQTTSIEQSAYSSTYIISQKYDVAKEQELRLQEQVKKQRAYLWIVVVLMICICIGGYTYYINKKRKLELQLNNEQKKRLEQELESDRAILRARISERVEIAKDLYLWSSHHNEEIPDILGPLSPKQAASDLQNWRNFYTEFNLFYNNVLAKLKEKHPALTETDLQYIALTLLKYDITEMSFLLRIEKQTIWNRRTSVKRHLGMPDETNLNEWIINDMAKEYEIVEPQRIQPNTKKRRRKKEEEKK